jgi:hypothetical protein
VSTIGLYISKNRIIPTWFSTHRVSHIDANLVHFVSGINSLILFFNNSVRQTETLMKLPINLVDLIQLQM